MQAPRIYLALVVLLFFSCETYYTPVLEQMPEMMVVESRLTNDPHQNYVKLSMARNFNSTEAVKWITVAKVELGEVNGKTTRATQMQPGHYTFQETPIPGKTYVLRITYQNDLFESDPVVMPPLPKIDSLYALHKEEKIYQTNAYGKPQLFIMPGREISVDASLSPSLQNYLFKWRTILQWEYHPPTLPNLPPKPTVYGWKSFYDHGIFNLGGQQQFRFSSKMSKHAILTIGYNGQDYLDSVSLQPDNWILILDQYGISDESFDYRTKLNKQFTAEGSLFDPQVQQIYGNIHCKNNPSRLVLGYFDVNSYRQFRYFLNLGNSEKSKVTTRRLNTYPDIPAAGDSIVRPDFWQYN